MTQGRVLTPRLRRARLRGSVCAAYQRSRIETQGGRSRPTPVRSFLWITANGAKRHSFPLTPMR